VLSILDEDIFQELVNRKMRYKEKLKNVDEKEFQKFLQAVFESKRFQEVVSGLMKISKKYIDTQK
jgi:hypothetical protein